MISYNNNISNNNNYNDIQYYITIIKYYYNDLLQYIKIIITRPKHGRRQQRPLALAGTSEVAATKGGLWVTLEIFNDYTIYHGYILQMWIFSDFTYDIQLIYKKSN